MRDVCRVVDFSNYERCVDLAMRPLPVEYRNGGTITNIAAQTDDPSILYSSSP